MRTLLLTTLAALLLAGGTAAQQTAAINGATVPRLVRVADTFRPASGPTSPVESVTLSIYKDEQGGTALWSETQNVAVDAEGRYAVLMGSTLVDGVPANLFTTAEPRWLGVQFNRSGEVEQARIQVVSVPYALKAVDAETLGGKPASAYVLAPSRAEASAGAGTPPSFAGLAPSATPAVKNAKPQVTSGMTNCIAEFMNTTDLGCSNIWQNGINIGINTMNPTVAFDLGAGSFRVANYSAPSTGVGLELAYIPVNNSGYMFAYDRGALVAKDLNIGGSGAAITVKAGGNVGVGVSNPASKLDVAGDINLSGNLDYQGSAVLQPAAGGDTSAVAVGTGALANNRGTTYSTAVGYQALNSNTVDTCTAVGYQALKSNTAGGQENIAVGSFALLYNTTGGENTATGSRALEDNTTGSLNAAFGTAAMEAITGSHNTAIGSFALYLSHSGDNNIAIGYGAASNVGEGSNNNIEIGTFGGSGDSGTIRIGGGTSGLNETAQTSFFAAGIRGIATGSNNAVPVLIDSNGQLGTVSSSRRYKEDIQDMREASSGLLQLRPVTFRYKKPFEDGSKPIQYGLIAEEVAEVYPGLVARGADGQIETVKYQLLPTMLLNEVQRQERTIQEQQREIDALKAKLAELSSLEARLAALETATSAQR